MSSTKSASSDTTQPGGETLEALRKDAELRARWKLRYETIPSLETVIMGIPSGPDRDKLTEANIVLHKVVYGE